MISFVFGVFGSVLFWASFLGGWFLVGSILLKHIAPLSWEAIKTGKRPTTKQFSYTLKADKCGIFFAIISVYFFWPFILAGYIFCIFAKNIVWPAFRKAVISSSNIIPEINIKNKTENGENEQ